MYKSSGVTPMMEQYHRIKKNHLDAILFFRLGDFYEMFFEDAKIAAPVLEIALTSRQKIPMCGVPHHAVETYLAKLLRRGFKVAICEQVEDAAQARGVVKRDVVRVLTPGTAIELEPEGENESTYIASMLVQAESWGLAAIDLSTGRIAAAQSDSSRRRSLADEIFKYFPKEVTFPEGQQDRINRLLSRNGMTDVLESPQEEWIFDYTQAKNDLMDHFGVKSLAGYDLEDKPLAVSAAGALLYYLKQLRRDSLSLIRSITYVQPDEHMIMDSSSIKNLELVKNLRDGRRQASLLDIIDFTLNAMGGRLLKTWLLQPLLDRRKIEDRQEAVEDLLKHTIERRELREHLKDIFDLERLTGRISLAVAHPRDLVALKRSLIPLPGIAELLAEFSSGEIQALHKDWDSPEDL